MKAMLGLILGYPGYWKVGVCILIVGADRRGANYVTVSKIWVATRKFTELNAFLRWIPYAE